MSLQRHTSVGSFSWRENRKLSTSVDNIQREHERKIKKLTVQQSRFISKATARMMVLVKTSLNEKEKNKAFERSRPFKSSGVSSSTKSKGLKEKNLQNHNHSSSVNKSMQNATKLAARPPLPQLTPRKSLVKKPEIFNTSNFENKENPKDVLKCRSVSIPKGQDTKDVLRPPPNSAPKYRRTRVSFSIHPLSVSRQSIIGGSSPNLFLKHRRQSCPNVGWSTGRILVGGRAEKDAFENGLKTEREVVKQMEELKKCRYLRLPESQVQA